jgi:hypothetical protein
MLAATFPKLAKMKTAEAPYKLLLKFFNYSKRSRSLLELAGGAAYLKDFVMERDEKKNLSKDAFAKNIIKVQKSEIDFTGFQPLLTQITKVLEHSDKSK